MGAPAGDGPQHALLQLVTPAGHGVPRGVPGHPGGAALTPARLPADLGAVQGGRARRGDRRRAGRAGHPVPGEGDHALRVDLRQRAPLQKVGEGRDRGTHPH